MPATSNYFSYRALVQNANESNEKNHIHAQWSSNFVTSALPQVPSSPCYLSFPFLCFVGLSLRVPRLFKAPSVNGGENGEHAEGSISATGNPRPLAESGSRTEDGGAALKARVFVACPLADLLATLLL